MIKANADQPKRLIRIKEVLNLTGLSSTSMYREISLGRFPKPIKIAPRASAWVEADIQAWINERIAESEE